MPTDIAQLEPVTKVQLGNSGELNRFPSLIGTLMLPIMAEMQGRVSSPQARGQKTQAFLRMRKSARNACNSLRAALSAERSILR